MLKHKLQWLLLLAALLGVSQGVWGKYYIYGGTPSTDIKSWGTTPLTYSDNWNSFTIDLSGKSVNTDYFYGISTNSGGMLQNCSKQDWNNHLPVRSNGNFGNVIISSYNSNGKCNDSSPECTYYYMKIRKGSTNVRSVTISVTLHDQPINNCDGISVTAYAASIASVENTTPSLETRSSSNITSNSAKLYGYILATGTTKIDHSGIKVYSDAACNTLVGTFETSPTFATTGSYSIIATGLAANTTYYYKAYAHNSAGDAYGSASNFKTSAITSTAPVVRWGIEPTIEDNTRNLIPSAFIAKHGCENSANAKVTKLKLYIKKDSDPTTSSYDAVYEFTNTGLSISEFTTGTLYPNNTVTGVFVPGTDDFLSSLTSSTELHMGWVAINDNESNNTSAMSDIAVIEYEACSGAISELFITPRTKQILSGSSVQFTANTNDGATVNSYQWYQGSSPISGATNSTYTRSNITAGFTLKVTANNNNCGAVTSSVETYTVCSNPITEESITLAATGKNIDADLPKESIVFTATLSNSKTAHHWEWYLDDVSVRSHDASPETNSDTHTINFSGFESGTYNLKVEATGCPSETISADKDLSIKETMTPTNYTTVVNACPEGNKIAISHLFSPTPDDITVKYGSDDVTDKFSYSAQSGYLYFTATDEVPFSGRVFTVYAEKEGYGKAQAQLTLTFNKDVRTSGITITTPGADGTETTPYTAVNFKATISSPVADDVVLWSVSPSTASISPATTTSGTGVAKFKGTGNASGSGTKTYTVTARIQSSTCGVSETSATRTINVIPDGDEPCD